MFYYVQRTINLFSANRGVLSQAVGKVTLLAPLTSTFSEPFYKEIYAYRIQIYVFCMNVGLHSMSNRSIPIQLLIQGSNNESSSHPRLVKEVIRNHSYVSPTLIWSELPTVVLHEMDTTSSCTCAIQPNLHCIRLQVKNFTFSFLHSKLMKLCWLSPYFRPSVYSYWLLCIKLKLSTDFPIQYYIVHHLQHSYSQDIVYSQYSIDLCKRQKICWENCKQRGQRVQL